MKDSVVKQIQLKKQAVETLFQTFDTAD